MTGLRQLGQRIAAAAALTVLAALSWTPLPVLELLARSFAWVVFVVAPGRRRIAIDNILQAGLASTRAEASALTLRAFQSFGRTILETNAARRCINAENWREFVTLKISPEAEALLHKPRQGVIVASGHLGNWEVAVRAVSMIKPMCVVYRPFNNPYLNNAIHAQRSGENLHFVPRHDANPLRFLKALAAGEMIALMMDQHAADGRVAVNFFGRPAWTTKSVAMLHLTTRAPLVVASAIRTGPLRYEIRAVGPITIRRTGDREQDAFALTQALTAEIEKMARQCPDQYMWGHRRWKQTPAQAGPG